MKSESVWDKNQSKGQWFYLGLDGCYQLRTLRKFLHPSNRDGKDEDTQWFNALVLRKNDVFFFFEIRIPFWSAEKVNFSPTIPQKDGEEFRSGDLVVFF